MNRILCFAIAALLVGCSADSAVEIAADTLSFRIETTPQTKGALANDPSQMGSIGIYCAYTTQKAWDADTVFDLLENERLDYNADLAEWVFGEEAPTWGYSSITDKYTFMAYSPYADEYNNITPSVRDGELIVEYAMPSTCADQPDLMMATPRKDIYPQIGGTVTLNFQHALAAVGFSVRGKPSLTITEVTINGVVASGELSISDSGEMEWVLDNRSRVSYSAGIDSSVTPNVYSAESITLNDGYLMMIPQSCERVEIEITTYDTKEEIYDTQTISLGEDGVSEWECGKIYDYTIVLGNYDYTIEGTSNCYMLHPNGEEQLFYIPVEGRINTFWRDYADDSMTYENILSSSDEWEASLLWSDFNGNTNGFKVERVTSGFEPNDCVTYLCEPDFTTAGALSAMMVTLPSNITEGNFLIAVSLDGCILWSWHLWVTEYNPNIIAASNTARRGVYVYTDNGVEGEVHRYDTEDLWATLYDDRFIMDRNLGARDCDYATNREGVLHYQFGRKDPFPASNSISSTIVNDCVSFAEAVQNPTTFYIRRSEDYSWAQEGLTMGSSYLWFDKSVANDPDCSGKSIFDPSPLGWRVPRYSTFTVIYYDNCEYNSKDNALIYNNFATLPMTGYRSNYYGTVNDYGSQGSLRVSTQVNSSYGYNTLYSTYYVDPNKSNTLADGFCVRCIEE